MGNVLFPVSANSEEFHAVGALFKSVPKVPRAYVDTLSGCWETSNIVAIQRVENAQYMCGKVLHCFHSLQLSLEEQGLGFAPGVHTRWAFHGSDAIGQILADPMGFQPPRDGRTAWGFGTYFARDAQYVVNGGFCTPRPDGTKQLLVCLLATGMPCVGCP